MATIVNYTCKSFIKLTPGVFPFFAFFEKKFTIINIYGRLVALCYASVTVLLMYICIVS